MLEISPLLAAMTAELLAALLVVILWLTFGRSRKKKQDRAHAGEMVERINRTDAAHREALSRALPEDSSLLDERLRDETITEVLRKEKELYRQALQAFLSQDVEKLGELDTHVRGLSEPYAKLISQLLARAAPRMTQQLDTRAARAEMDLAIQTARAETARAREEISAAMGSLYDISEEYAKMFGNSHSAVELRESAERVLGSLQRTSDSLKTTEDWLAGDEAAP